MATLSSFLVYDYYDLEDMLVEGGFITVSSGGSYDVTPTLSGTTLSGICTVHIENYNSNNFYWITCSGTYALEDDIITWTLPEQEGTYILNTYTASVGHKLSLPGQIQEVVESS